MAMVVLPTPPFPLAIPIDFNFVELLNFATRCYNLEWLSAIKNWILERDRPMVRLVGMFVALFSLSMASIAAEPEIVKYGDWTNVCNEGVNGLKQCTSTQVLTRQLETGQNVRVLQSTIVKLNDSDFVFQFVLPLGVDLRPGIAFQIDQGNQRSGQFFTCITSGCIVRFALNGEFATEVQNGATGQLVYRNANDQKPSALQVSLKGVTAAMNAL